jgi:phosphate transport system substrate-binding protein
LLINGAGATFPYPIYIKWFDEYYKIRPQVQFNYQSIGSGGGIRQLQAGTVDFGATDSPMTDEQLQQSKSEVFHFPTVIGAVVVTYNLPGVSGELKFTQEALAGIFLGTIRDWNHPELIRANPQVPLPAERIVVVHRADGSGTTYVWTDFLSKVSSDWKDKVGQGTSVNWPIGLGAKGNEGVAGLVKQIPYTIGYVELVYALQNSMPCGRVENAAGNFSQPSLSSVATAASGVSIPEDFRISITNSPAETAYPISSFTWLLIPSRIADTAKKQATIDFLNWMLSSGQPMATPLGYAPLPLEVISKEKKAIRRIE